MARSRPAWFDAALAVLLAGGRIADAARAANVRRETVSRAMRDPESAFAQELERLRAAAASTTTTSGLVEKATRVVEQHLDGGDARAALDAAKLVIGKLAPPTAQPEPSAEEQVSNEAAIKELTLTLPTLPAVLREGVSSELVNELRQALRAALTDLDSQPQAPPTPPPPAAPPRPAGPLLN